MKEKPLTFTKFQGFSSLATLMACARESYFIGELIEKAIELLPQPSLITRLEAAKDFVRIFLRSPIPREDPVVQFWHLSRSEKTQREIVLIQFMLNYPLLDLFVSDFLYPQLYKRGERGLFHGYVARFQNKEINEFLKEHLNEVSESTFRSTRNTLRSLLAQYGLLKREEKAFPTFWEIRPYRPTFTGWLFALTSELEGNRRVPLHEIQTPKRLLMTPGLFSHFIKATVSRGWGFKENGLFSLTYPHLMGLVKKILVERDQEALSDI